MGGGMDGSEILPPPPLLGKTGLTGLTSMIQVTGAVVGPKTRPVFGSIATLKTLPPLLRLVVLGFVYPLVDWTPVVFPSHFP